MHIYRQLISKASLDIFSVFFEQIAIFGGVSLLHKSSYECFDTSSAGPAKKLASGPCRTGPDRTWMTQKGRSGRNKNVK